MQIFIHTLSCFPAARPDLSREKTRLFLSCISQHYTSFFSNFNDIFPASVICAKKFFVFSEEFAYLSIDVAYFLGVYSYQPEGRAADAAPMKKGRLEMMKKNVLAMGLALTMALGLTACGSSSNGSASSGAASGSASQNDASASAPRWTSWC